jgi:hypothetical protein
MSKETKGIAIFVSFLVLATFSTAAFGQGKSQGETFVRRRVYFGKSGKQ